ncbi:hypothetical protein FXF51_42375 [Nonomuraea sp. PA05]|uniref:hypothetical protein n=1 Tax=Nonomuraea sp. PA05 TaxID=2604466 RepID=UPI0011D73E4A|nr:hypothetical protein [Nonomuraea sp. PA05]TYB56764.1 hypothetical protein FXF51_42375 [Nonomuraea sp. PA05]
MLVILAIAAVAILACVVLVSLGRGGELTEFPPDVPPLDLPEAGHLTAVDFMALQLPVNLVGYHTQSVDETLRRAAGAISARDTRIAVLEQRVSELLSSRLHARQEIYAAPGAGPRTEHTPEAPATPRELPESGDPVSVSGATVDWNGGAELDHLPEEAEWRVPQPGATEPATNGKADDTPHDTPAEEQAADSPASSPAADSPADKPADAPAQEAKDGSEPEPEAAKEPEAGDGEQPVRAAAAKDGDEHR